MKMEFLVLSRAESERQKPIPELVNKSHVWVSINCPEESPAKIYRLNTCLDVLYVAFHDIDEHIDGYRIMSEYDAGLIVDFVDKYKNDVDMIVVNCHAGISRSSGTAAALSLWLNNGVDVVTGSKAWFHPNIHVKSTISKIIRDRFG